MNDFIFLSILFAFSLFVGKLLEKLRIPWVFSALFFGLILTIINNDAINSTMNSGTIEFLANLGMLFLLFIIGLEIDIKQTVKQSKFIAKFSLSLVFIGAIVGSVLIHFIFNTPWLLSIIVASSFATVGEAILIPILDEFKLLHTKFGQFILNVGTFDDIVELLVIIIVSFMISTESTHAYHWFQSLLLLIFLFFIPVSLYFFHDHLRPLKFKKIPPLFLFALMMLFLFVGIGMIADSDALGAILAGISLKMLLNEKYTEEIKGLIRAISYGFFTLVFFAYVGFSINLEYLFKNPLLVVVFFVVPTTMKILTSYVLGKDKFGKKEATLMGVGLSAKFSTSIVILTLLSTKRLISIELYSVLIGAMILSQFLIPVIFSELISKFKVNEST